MGCEVSCKNISHVELGELLRQELSEKPNVRLATWFMREENKRMNSVRDFLVNGYLSDVISVDGYDFSGLSPLEIAEMIGEMAVNCGAKDKFDRTVSRVVPSVPNQSFSLNGLANKAVTEEWLMSVFDAIGGLVGADRGINDQVRGRYAFLMHNMGIDIENLVTLNLSGDSSQAAKVVWESGLLSVGV